LSSIEQHAHSDLESSNPFGIAFAIANSDALVRDSHRLRDRPDPVRKSQKLPVNVWVAVIILLTL
jgi:hypothetical protein